MLIAKELMLKKSHSFSYMSWVPSGRSAKVLVTRELFTAVYLPWPRRRPDPAESIQNGIVGCSEAH